MLGQELIALLTHYVRELNDSIIASELYYIGVIVLKERYVYTPYLP
jgi:hypothetical protein